MSSGQSLRVRETIHGICQPYAMAPWSSIGIRLPRVFSLAPVGGAQPAPMHIKALHTPSPPGHKKKNIPNITHTPPRRRSAEKVAAEA